MPTKLEFRMNRPDCALLYERRSDWIRVATRSLTNHELREVITGLWLLLDDDDRADHIAALTHYSDPASTPSPLAKAIESKLKASRERDAGS